MSTALRIQIAEYDRLVERGFFAELAEKRIELIYGELREMNPAGPSHEHIIGVLTDWYTAFAPHQDVALRVQMSVGITPLDSVPEPDIAWVRRRNYSRRRAQVEDVALLIEVADSSLAYDCGEKAALYAQAGIRDYWVVSIPEACVHVFREPRGDAYSLITRLGTDERVAPLAFPAISLEIGPLFEYGP